MFSLQVMIITKRNLDKNLHLTMIIHNLVDLHFISLFILFCDTTMFSIEQNKHRRNLIHYIFIAISMNIEKNAPF